MRDEAMKLVAAGILEALEDSDVELRTRLVDEFARVDEIKAAPGWEPFVRQNSDPMTAANQYRVDECAWCGDNFVNDRINGRWSRSCSLRCDGALRSFKNRRRRVA